MANRRKLTDADDREIARLYLDEKQSTGTLAAAYGVNDATIRRALDRQGVPRRSLKEAQGGLTAAQEQEAGRRYLAKEPSTKIAAAYGVSISTILGALHRQGVKMRGSREGKRRFTPAQDREIARLYLDEKKSTGILAAAYGVDAHTIYNALDRQGVPRRSLKEANGGLTDEQELEIACRYLAKEQSPRLAATYGVSIFTICNILRRQGVEMRTSDGFGDSVEHALNGTGHHSQVRDCEFYVYELARYGATHCKPGIAFDADLRADEEYGTEVLRLVFATRQEAFFLEQAVLDATRGYADCPAALAGWIGASEVRAMPAADLVPIALRLAEEMEEAGIWDFAAARVPMTAAQRALCQQRALLGAPACPAAT